MATLGTGSCAVRVLEPERQRPLRRPGSNSSDQSATKRRRAATIYRCFSMTPMAPLAESNSRLRNAAPGRTETSADAGPRWCCRHLRMCGWTSVEHPPTISKTIGEINAHSRVPESGMNVCPRITPFLGSQIVIGGKGSSKSGQ